MHADKPAVKFSAAGLTIHSSRTRFVASFKCVVVPLPQLTDQQVAGRLNSGVRPRIKQFFLCVIAT